MRSVLIALIALFYLSFDGLSNGALADEPTTTQGVSQEIVSAKLQDIEQSTTLDEATRTKLTELYREAQSDLEKAGVNDAQATLYREARDSAPAKARTVREELASAEAEDPLAGLQFAPDATLVEVEQALQSERAERAAAAAKLDDLEQRLAAERGRPDAIQARLIDAKTRIEAIDTELESIASDNGADAMLTARRIRLAAERASLIAEVASLEAELVSGPARVQLMTARRDRNAYRIRRGERRAQWLEDRLNALRRTQAEEVRAEAEAVRERVKVENPIVQRVADNNLELGAEIERATALLEEVVAEKRAIDVLIERIEWRFRNAQQTLEIAGLSRELAALLYEQRERLPNRQEIWRGAEERRQQFKRIGLSRLRHEDERAELIDLAAATDGLIAEIEDPAERVEVKDQIRPLLEARRDLLEQTIAIDDSLVRTLGELDTARDQLLQRVREFESFLAEHLLLVRNTGREQLFSFDQMPAELTRLAAWSSWRQVFATLYHQATHSPVLAIAIVLFTGLFMAARRLKRALRATAERLGKPTTDRFYYTLQALGLTAILAVTWPAVFATTAWQLSASSVTAPFVQAAGSALLLISIQLFHLRFWWFLCMRGGLADAHLRWPHWSLQQQRKAVRQLTYVLVSLAFIATLSFNLEPVTFGGMIGRLTFVFMMLVYAHFFYKILFPDRGVFRPFLERNSGSLYVKLHKLWLPAIVIIPLALAFLGFAGYMNMAASLARLVASSMWFIFGLIVLHELVMRWLLVTRRKLSYAAAIQRQESRRQRAEQGGTLEEHLQTDDSGPDVLGLSDDTRRLVNLATMLSAIAGLWWIWADVLPALSRLDDLTLWYYTAEVDGETTRIATTVTDLAVAIAIAIGMFIGVRTVPGVVEMILLTRFEANAADRYTARVLTTYLIITIAVVAVFSVVGFSWSKIQWLVAALGVGIGFGLQEIVANFISGLIILFERPIRVGDIVTVADTDGVVTRIRIRATTIRNWDRKELLVPNKEFITGRVLNWTLSDPVNRIVIIVGADYGADVEQALALLGEAAAEHPEVLDDPAPLISFEGFGDNSLTLILRCYLGSMDHRIACITDLHTAIHRKFAAAGISIAFPQRDVHLKTGAPLELIVRDSRDKG